MKVLYTLLLMFVVASLSAQDKAIVTDLRHVVVNQHQFPNYFSEDKEWEAKVVSKIDTMIKTRLGLASVDFVSNNKVNFLVSPTVDEPSFRLTTRSSAYRVSILSNIEESFSFDGTSLYKLIVRFEVANSENKLLVKEKSAISFKVIQGEDLYGEKIIAKDDFVSLYEETLDELYEKKKKKVSYRKVSRPIATSYESFLAQSEEIGIKMRYKVSVFEFFNYYTVVNKKGNLLGNIELNGKFNEGVTSQSKNSSVKQIYTLNNSLNKESHEIITSYSHSPRLNGSENSELLISFGAAGQFMLTNATNLTGSKGDKEYQLKYNPNNQLAEIYEQGKLKLLLQAGPEVKEEGKVLLRFKAYHLKNLNESELGDLLNVFISHQIAEETQVEHYGKEEVRNNQVH